MKLVSKITAVGVAAIAFLTANSNVYADGGPTNPYGPYGKVHGVVDTALGTVDPLFMVVGTLLFVAGFIVVSRSVSLRNKLSELK